MQKHLPFFFLLLFTVSAAANDVPPKPTEADTAFERGDYVAALNMYLQLRDEDGKDVRSSEKRKDAWIAHTAQAVRCYSATGNAELAVQEYFLLCQVASADRTPLDCIPLPWFTPSDKITVGLRPHEKTAIDRLDPIKFQSPGPSATLLAAAVLSVSADNARRNQGISLLRNLESQYQDDELKKAAKEGETAVRQQVALLASAFLWKQRIPRLRLTTELTALRRTIDRMPEELRAGPYFLLGQSARQVGDDEAAVLAFMRLPVLYPHQRAFGVEALREAALSLKKLGRSDQAEILRQEAGSGTQP